MKLLRIGICAVVTFAVLSHGAVEPWSRAVLEVSAGVLLFLWTLIYFPSEKEKAVTLPTILFPLACFSVVVTLQYVLGLTASRFSTRIELALLLAMLALLFVAAQAFRTLNDFREFAWFVMVLAFLVAGLGILQHLTFNGKLYWFREMRYGGIPFGPYVNRNHFAGFSELVLPMSLVPLLAGRVRRQRLMLVGILAVIPLSALILSSSRGGIISLGAELVLLATVLLWQRTGGRNLLVGGAVLVLAFSTVSWIGVNQVLSRFSALQNLEVGEGKRAAMRAGAWGIFLDHPVLGAGLGTLQQVYPPYETLYDGKIVNHAHNDYLEALAETGLLGGLCCAWFLGTLFAAGLNLLRSSEPSLASTLRLCGFTACGGLLVHSLVDFNLHIPSNLLLFLLMGFLATTEILPSRPERTKVRGHSQEEKPD